MRTVHDIKEKLKSRKTLRNNPTAQEIILWSRLRIKQFGYKFRRQHSIGKYIADFYCPEKKLIIELDGWQHTLENNKKYDKERTAYFQKLGYKVLRFWNNDINNNLKGVCLEIEKYF
ncbi:MAG TPA: endonuclease domain-containing protein [Candidatus Gracilibacteria bacterium]|nr:endonuclease domain-containing protein [Candidatus Gracilibacteria bacterium]